MLTANHTHIIVQVAHTPQVTDSGLFLPDLTNSQSLKVGRSRTATQEAVVISVGPDVAIPLAAGDRIIYDKFAGTPLLHDEIEYLVLAPDHIMCKLDKESSS